MGKNYVVAERFEGQLELGDVIMTGEETTVGGRKWMLVPAVLGATCAYWQGAGYKNSHPLFVKRGQTGAGHRIFETAHTIEERHFKTPHHMLVELGQPFLHFEFGGKKLALIARSQADHVSFAYHGISLLDDYVSLFKGTSIAAYLEEQDYIKDRIATQKVRAFHSAAIVFLDDFVSRAAKVDAELTALCLSKGEMSTPGGMAPDVSRAWSDAVSLRLKALEAGPPRDYSNKPTISVQGTFAEDHEGIDLGFRR